MDGDEWNALKRVVSFSFSLFFKEIALSIKKKLK